MAEQSRLEEKPWLQSYEQGVSAHVEYEPISMPAILDRTVSQFPHNTALIFQGYRMNFAALKKMVERCAACLAAFGIGNGDAVAILLPNVIPCVVAYYAIWRLGAIAVPNNPLYSDRELEHQFNDSGSKVLITLDLLANRMIDLRSKTSIRQIVYTSIGDYLPFPKSLLFPLVAKKKNLAATVKAAPDVYAWRDCMARTAPNPPAVEVGFEDVATYQYTGGTTGVSKGVMLTHANLSTNCQQIEAWFPTFKRGAEVMLGALPFFHSFGMTTAMNLSIYLGWADVIIPRPQPEQLLESIRRFRPTFAPLVPTMYIGMLNHPDIGKTDMTCLKGCFSGSAPLPVEVIRDFEARTGAVIVEGFGMTETTPVTHINPFAGGARKVGSVGVPVPDTDARIVDLEDGVTDMPVDEPGELIVKGPQIMQGYRNRPDETAHTLRDGWCYTGDIAIMDEDGYFYIVDRKKDMIISGGFNIYPRDIEEVLYEHPAVQEACAIGIPHDVRGENVKVFIVVKEGEAVTSEELIEYCSTKLAKYKLPADIEFRQELPKSTVGKILRKELRVEELEKRKATPA